jgi:hypothetical protein
MPPVNEVWRLVKIIGAYNPEWARDPYCGLYYGIVRVNMPVIRQDIYVSVYFDTLPEGVKAGDKVWIVIDLMAIDLGYKIRNVSGFNKLFGKGRREQAKENRIKCVAVPPP